MKTYQLILLLGFCLLLGKDFTSAQAQALTPPSEPILTIPLAESGYDRANSLAISPDGKLMAVGSSLGIYFYNFPGGQEVRFIPTETWVRSLAFTPDGNNIVTGSYDNLARLWRVADGRLLREFKGHTAWVQVVAISPDGEILASASDDSTIRLWRVSDGILLRTLSKDTGGVRALAFSPDGEILATGGFDKTVRLLKVSDGTLLRSMEGHTDWIRCLAFSPDGSTIASGGFDTTTRLWRVADGNLLFVLKGHTSSVLGVAFAPDGKALASASVDTTLRIWRVSDGSLLDILEGHKDFVFTVAFGSDGKYLATGSVDNTVKLWDVRGINDLAPMAEASHASSAGVSPNCGACHHPQGLFMQPGGVSSPPRVLEVGCSTCHKGGVVVMNWCPAFARSFEGISLSVAPPVSSEKVGVPLGNRELGVVISTVGNSEHFYSAPIITALPVGGRVYYAGNNITDVKVTLEIMAGTKQVATLTTQPQPDGAFSFNLNMGSSENELDVPIEQRTCIYCHSDTNKNQPYAPAGEVRLSITAQAPDGVQASDQRWIVVDRSQIIPAVVNVVGDDNGKPVAGLTIEATTRIYKWLVRKFGAESDVNGQATLHIEGLSQTPTIYEIQVAPTVVDGVMYEGVEPLEVTLPQGADSIPEITLRVKKSNGQINGIINRGGVNRMPKLQVWAVHVPDGVSYTAQTSDQGTFVFDNIPVDKYLITTDLDALALQGFSLLGKTVDLRSSSSIAPVDLELVPLEGRLLNGVVQDANQQTIPFAWLTVEKLGLNAEVMPDTGNYMISSLPSRKVTVTVSAPGYYSQAQPVDMKSEDHTTRLDFALVKRPETQNVAWGNGVVTIPPESLVKLDGKQILFDHGWLWGSADQAPNLIIKYGQMTIVISSGRFALSRLPNQVAWMYIFSGEASISSTGYPDPVKIGSGNMVALDQNSVPVPVKNNALLASVLRETTGLPIQLIWQPELSARIRDELAQFGISVAEIMAFITYGLIAISVVAWPLIGIYAYLKRRRTNS